MSDPAGKADGPAGPTSKALSLIYGVVAYFIFLGTFLYAVGFVGNLVVPKSIDTAPATPVAEVLTVDLVLLGLFAVQHSLMARHAFKRSWTWVVPSHLERSTYVLASSLLLILLFWLWRPLPEMIWHAEPPLAGLVWVLFGVGWTIVLLSTFLIDHFDLFGLRQVYLYARGRPYTPPSFRTTGLYKVVRHPIMVGFVIAFWAAPMMTWGHLLFAGMTTAYILVGVRLEERDLKTAFGVSYGEYRRQVGMLVPRPRF
jgi:protein-S-isoprenylcysteine O-methyltransferase Ste14